MSALRLRSRAGATVALSATALATLSAYAVADGSLLGATAVRAEADGLRGAALARYQAPVQNGVAQPDSPTSFDATLPNGRRVTPAGANVHVGENPLGAALTPDGRYLVVSDDDERNTGKTSTSGTSKDATNGAGKVPGGFVLTVVRTSDMSVVSNVAAPVNPRPHPGSTIPGRSQSDKGSAQLFAGVVTLPGSDGTTRVYAAGGTSNTVDEFTVSPAGTIASTRQISVPVPKDTSKPNYGMATPGGLALGPDGRTLYVVLNNGDAVTTLDTATDTMSPSATAVGHFPYAAAVAAGKLFVSNWGVADRHFADGKGELGPDGTAAHGTTPYVGGGRDAHRFAPPTTDAGSSSLSVLDLAGGPQRTLPLAPPVDGLHVVGGTHPSALATATRDGRSVVYVADANDDTVAIVDARAGKVLGKLALPQPAGTQGKRGALLGLVPNALATSPDGDRLYVAEAGVNAVSVFDTSDDLGAPEYLGRIPTGWYPTALNLSGDGRTLFVTNSKGAGEPYGFQGTYTAPGAYTSPDVNLLFGSVQKVDLDATDLDDGADQVRRNNVARASDDREELVQGLQEKVKHVVYVLRENKTYDSYLGDDAVLNARGANGSPQHAQFGKLVPNLKQLAETYAVGDNSYADAEESDAGHSFALAGTSTDYQQKTLLSRFSRPLVNTKNEDPEDYPLRGYLFENAARHGVSYRDYGDMLRVSGYDEGNHPDPCADDPYPSCTKQGYRYLADKTSPTAGFGGRYSTDVPALASLAGHVDERYPGWNLRIGDVRRANEFVRDFDAQVKAGTAPRFTFLWLPTDHTGGCGSPTCTPSAQVADADEGLGVVMKYLTHSAIWPSTAVFLTQDDAQGSPDHVAAHRSYTVVASPFARKGYVSHRLSSTVSVAKTIEEILGLPAMNVGDATANDLLDYFDPATVSGDEDADDPGVEDKAVTAPAVPAETQRIAALLDRLPTRTYDADGGRLGRLDAIYMRSLALAGEKGRRGERDYDAAQDALYEAAREVVGED